MKFNYDNALFRTINKIVDCVFVSILWLLCSLPIFTIGASTSGLYYTVHKSIRGNRGYAARSFFKGFKDSFKQATLAWIVVLLVFLLFLTDAYLMRKELNAGKTLGSLFYFFVVSMVVVVGWFCYIFPYIARFNNTVKQILKNAIIMEICHLPWTLLLILIFAVVIFLVWLLPPLIFLLPAAMMLLYDLILERIFRRYMNPEDLERELEIERLDKQEDEAR